MKKLILLFSITAAQLLKGQVFTNSTNVVTNPTSTFVGINKNSPRAVLHSRSAINYRNLGTGLLISGNGAALAPGIVMEELDSTNSNIGGISFWNNRMLFFRHTGNGNVGNNDLFMSTDVNGRVAIGSNLPQNNLHIQGGTRIDNLPASTFNRIITANANGDLQSLNLGTNTQFLRGDGIWASIPTSGNTTNNCNTINYLPRLTGANTFGCSQIIDNGRIGIGTATPQGFIHVTMPNNLLYRNLGAGQVITGNGGAPGLIFEETANGNSSAISSWNNQMVFLKRTGAGNYTAANIFMSADANGRVAVGPNIAMNTLHVQGGTRVDNLPNVAFTRFITANANGDLQSFPVTGTPSTTTYLRGDGTWATISSGGNVSSTCSTQFMIPRVGTTGSPNLVCSQIFDNGTSVGVNTTGSFNYTLTTLPASSGGTVPLTGTVRFDVNGVARFTGFYATSDQTLKTNIKPLENPNNLILKLNGHTYQWTNVYQKESGVDNGIKFGFLAQEVEKIMPEAVIKDENGRYAVEYNAFIPVLVESQKQLIKENEALKAKLSNYDEKFALLEKTIAQLCENGCAGLEKKIDVDALYQSIPNPTDSEALINYYLSREYKNATISVYNQVGKEMKTVKLESSKGNGSIKVDLRDLSSGTYIYTLVAEERVIDSKKLQIVK